MAFQKGQSGNPGGRKPVAPEVKELARQHAPEAMRKLVELVGHSDPRVARAAAVDVLDRAYGKPTQPIAGDDDAPPIGIEQRPSVEALAKLSPKDREAIRTILGRAIGGPEADGQGA